MKRPLRKVARLLLIVLVWPVALFILGAIFFTFILIEHGSLIYVVVLCWAGLMIGLLHALIIYRRQGRVEAQVNTDET